jgi:acyl-coenzyme A thioesterase PaaI-like protein
MYDGRVTDPVHSSHDARETTTLISVVPKAPLSVQSEKHFFVKRMESESGFEEITAFPRRLTTPALLDVGRRTWIERTGKSAISVFHLDSSHTGYAGLVHGGILAALVDEGCAEYSNRGALTLYPLTKYLGVEFQKPSPTGGVFIAKVSTSAPFPLTTNKLRKVWVKCEISVLRGEDKMIPVVKASALFILCEKLPQLPSCGEAGDSIEDIFTYGGDERIVDFTPARIARDRWGNWIFIVAAFVAGIWVSYQR